MNISDWSRRITSFIHEIADVDIQEKVWLTRHPVEQSSFTEVICGLYDDCSFESYLLELNNHKINSKLLTRILIFKSALDDYLSNIESKNLSDRQIVADPDWQVIVLLAVNAECDLNSIIEIITDA